MEHVFVTVTQTSMITKTGIFLQLPNEGGRAGREGGMISHDCVTVTPTSMDASIVFITVTQSSMDASLVCITVTQSSMDASIVFITVTQSSMDASLVCITVTKLAWMQA